MADSWRDRAAQSGAQVAAPAGYQQTVTQNDRQVEQGVKEPNWRDRAGAAGAVVPPGGSSGSVAWGTGGNIEDIENGWNTPFYDTMFKQRDEAAQAGTLNTLYERPDFTGIVTTDTKGDKKFGDIFQNGQRQGNIYEDQGYDKVSADWIMGRLLLDKTVFAKARTPEQLAAEVEKARKDATVWQERGAGAAAFEADVNRTSDEFQENGWAQVGVVAGGAGGGALTGFGVGVTIGSVVPVVGTAVVGGIGAVVGAVGGGVSAWLNQDEILDAAARTKVQVDRAADEGAGSLTQAATALQGAGELGMKFLTPVGNLVHGLYDVSKDGNVGDGDNAWYETDPVTGESTRNGWVTAAGYASIIPDSIGTFGAKAARFAYTGLMGGNVAGQVGTMVASGGETWDDRRGDFDNVFLNDDGSVNLLSGAAGVGAIGIDAIQTVTPAGLFRAVRDSARLGTRSAERVSVGGWSYQLDDAGRAIEGSRRLSLGFFAPSEFTTGLAASALARRGALGGAATRGVSADDYYRAATNLASGRSGRAGTVVTALGEGYEEGIQAVLEPISHEANVDWASVGDSFVTGTLFGAGMGVVAAGQSAKQDRIVRNLSDTSRELSGQKPYTDKQWEKLSDVQRRASAISDVHANQAIQTGEANLEHDQKLSMVAQFSAVEQRVAEAQLARESAILRSGAPLTDRMFRITQTEDATVAPNAAQGSLTLVRNMYAQHAVGLKEAVATEADPDLRGNLERTSQIADQIVAELNRAIARYQSSDGAGRELVIDGVNELLRRLYSAEPGVNRATGQPLSAEELTDRAKAATIIFSRDPLAQDGSFQALLPIVHKELTRFGNDASLQVGHGILQALGGDFDGDKLRQQARIVVDDSVFAKLRAGTNLVKVDGTVNTGTMHYEEWSLIEFGKASQQDTSSLVYGFTTSTIQRIADALTALIPNDPRLIPIIDQLETNMRAGDKKAKSKLLDAISLTMGDEIQALGESSLQNMWLLIDNAVKLELQYFQRAAAGRLSSKGLAVGLAAPKELTTTVFTRRKERAVTAGQTLAQAIQGAEMFRLFQALRYSKARSTVDAAVTSNTEKLAELTATFNLIGEGLVMTARQAIEAPEVTERVRAKIDILAHHFETTAAAIANAPAGLIDGVPSNRTVLQQVLADEVEVEKQTFAGIIDTDPAVKARIGKIEALTKGSKASGSRAGAAFVEVYATTPMYVLAGEHALEFGLDLTVGQYADRFFNQSPTKRRADKKLLSQVPEYLGRKGTSNIPYGAKELQAGEISGYRSVVDSIMDYSNHKLSRHEDGADAGKPYGDLARTSNRVGTAVKSVATSVQDALSEASLAFTPENVARLLEADAQWGLELLRLVPNGAIDALTRQVETSDGTTVRMIAPWLFEALTLPPEQAEAHIWRNILWTTWNGTALERGGRQYSELNDRFHQLMFRLASQDDGQRAIKLLQAEVWQQQSVEQIEKLLNEKYFADQAPFVAWVRDVSEFEADQQSGGWSQTLPGAVEREQISKLKSATSRLVTNLRNERQRQVADTETKQSLVRGRQDINEGRPATADAIRYARLSAAIKAAQNRLQLLGPVERRNLVATAALSFYGLATDKGRVPLHLLPVGALESQLDYYGTNYEISRSSLLGYDVATVAGQPSLASRSGGLVFTDSDGTPIEFDGLTEDFVIDNWGDSASEQFILSILVPQAYAFNPETRTLQSQFLTEPSLTGVVNGVFDEELLKREHQDVYASMIEAYGLQTGDRNQLTLLLQDLVIQNTSVKYREQGLFDTARSYDEILPAVTRVLQAVGDLAATRQGDIAVEELRDMVRTEMHQRFTRSSFNFGSGSTAAALQEVFEARLADARAKAAIQLARTGDTAQFAAERTRLDLFRASLDQDIVGEMIALFRDNAGQPGNADHRRNLTEIVLLNPQLVTKAPWAHVELTTLLNAAGRAYLDSDGNPMLDDTQWSVISRVLIANSLQQISGVEASDELVLPKFPDYRDLNHETKGAAVARDLTYWDPSRVRLFDPLFEVDGPLVRAARDIFRNSGYKHSFGTPKQVFREFKRNFLPEEGFRLLGRWTIDLPTVLVESRERPGSAGAEMKISMAGLAPARNAVIDRRAARSVKSDELDSFVSTTSPVPVLALLSPQGNELAAEIPVMLHNGRESAINIAALNGRFVRSAVVTLPDGTEVDLLQQGYPAPKLGMTWARGNETPPAAWKAITLRQLRAAIEFAVPAADRKTATISLEMLHPDSLPNTPDYRNNVYFEGLANENPAADDANSLISALWVAAGGLSPEGQDEALTANKTGSSAILLSSTFGRGERTMMQLGWQVDLGATLRKQARALMSVQEEAANVAPVLWNAVMKDLKMGQFVRGINEAGEPELWTVEQVIDWQNNNQGSPITDVLTDAELYTPSPSKLRSFYGDRRSQSEIADIALGVLEADYSGYEPFDGRPTAKQLSTLRGALTIDQATGTWATRSIVSAVAGNQRQATKYRRGSARVEKQDQLRNRSFTIRTQTERDAVYGERREAKYRDDISTNTERIYKEIRSYVTTGSAIISFSDMSGPSVDRATSLSQSTEAVLIDDLFRQAQANRSRAFWYLTEDTRSADKTRGIITGQILDSGSGAFMPTRDDVVNINVDSFGDDIARAQLRVEQVMNTGATINLVSPSGSTEMKSLLGNYLSAQMQYEPAPGARFLFQPIEEDAQYQNVRANESSLLAMEGFDPAGRVIIAESVDAVTDENAAMRVQPIDSVTDLSGEILITTDLLPTQAFSDFGPPRRGKTIVDVKTHIRNTPFAFLLQQSGARTPEEAADFKAAYDKLIDRWDNSEDADILPAGHYGPGDLVPLVRTSAVGVDILLYRHGNKAPTRVELEAALEAQVPGTNDRGRIAIYSPQEEKAATIHTGEVRRVVRKDRYGYRVQMSIPLREYNDKKVLELSGMKYVITSLSKMVKLPSIPLFRNWGIDYYTDTWSADSKNAWTDRLTNHRLAFAVYGVDFEPDLVEFRTGKKQGDPGYEQALIETHTWLDGLSRDLPKQDLRTLRRVAYQGLDAATLQILKDASPTAQGVDWTTRLVSSTASTVREQELAGIVSAFMIYLMAPAATRPGEQQYRHILRSGGINADGGRVSGRKSQKMPPLFTEIFDRLPIGHPTRSYLNRTFNAQVQRDGDAGYWINEDFTVTITGDNGEREVVWLKFPEVHSSGDNPARDMQVNDRGTTQPASLSSQNVVSMTMGGRVAVSPSDAAYEAINEVSPLITTFESGTADLYAIPEQNTPIRWHQKLPGEAQYEAISVDIADEYLQPVDFTAWQKGRSKKEYDLVVAKATAELRRLTQVFGLDEKQAYVFHHFARQLKGKGQSPDPLNKAGNMSYELFMEALADIQVNIDSGKLPVVGGEIPQIHHSDLALLYGGRRRAQFRLRMSDVQNDYADTWQDWVAAGLAFGESNNTVFDPLFLTAVDGMLASFRANESSLVGLPVTRNDLRRAELLDSRTDDVLRTVSPGRMATLTEPIILDRAYVTIDSILGVQRQGDRWTGGAPRGSASAKLKSARTRWRKEQKTAAFPVETSIVDVRSYSAQWVHDQSTSNALVRTLSNLRFGMATINPQLWISAGLEGTLWNALNKGAALLQGTTAGKGSQYTPDQQALITRTLQALGSRPEFKAMVYGDILYQQERGGHGLIEGLSQRFAKVGMMLQDPSYGLKGHTMARIYMEAVLEWVAANPLDLVISVENMMERISTDPQWVAKNMNRAHKMGMARIAGARGLKPTPLTMALNGVIDPLSKNPNFGLGTTTSILLKIPLIFSTYAISTGTKLTGLQAASDMLAMVLDGRENKFAGIQRWLAGDVSRSDNPVHFDMAAALEGIDLTRSFAQSGITHTALFALGSMLGGLGLGGEDEEERRRRRAQIYQTGQIVYDPRDIINDFRNADAVFLDWLPFGLGQMFAIPDPEGTNSSNSMAQLPWFLRQFVSPLLGMSKALETGDIRQLVWGYEDALASFPLINAGVWNDATDVVGRLAQQAEEVGVDGENGDAQLEAWGFMINIVATYERMLFENSFVNMLYVNADQYDRNPWVLPMTDIDGNIIRPDLNQPAETTALDQYVDPETGEVSLTNKQRDFWDATLHGFTENRGTLALAMSLFTGQGLGGSTLRQNMVTKTRSIDKETLSEEAVLDLVSGLYTGSGQNWVMSEMLGDQETVTSEGAAAIIRGAWQGSVTLDSPALQGVYIPFQMRQQLEAYFLESLVQEGLDAGLSEYNAKGHMYDVWYGVKGDPNAIGLKDIVWSDKIPYAASDTYRQLNTTYVMGPDNRPWATGVQRNTLQSMFGLAPAAYMTGDQGNLGVDGSLNSTDAARNLNTGMRGLEKVNQTDWVPTPEEIGQQIEDAITKAMNKQYTSDGSGNGYFYGRGGGGGGGGGGYNYRVNSPVRNESIYGRNVPYVNVDNPILRRATIRRERFSSERGRLKPWQ